MLRRAAKVMLDLLARSGGYRLTPSNLTDWPEQDAEFREVFERQAAFGWKEFSGPKIRRMYMIRNLILSAPSTGDWAECGVFKGATALVMAEYGRRYGLLAPGHEIHLFDSFEGLSAPGEADGATPMVRGDYVGTEDEVRANLAGHEVFRFHRGWIPDRFEEVAGRRFSFVHVDVDLYGPVKDCLDFFLPRMMPGGIIALDDYGCAETPGALRATDEMAQKYHVRIAALPYGQAFIIVNKRECAAGSSTPS